MTEASNLGQIIGRLLYAVPVVPSRVCRRDQVLALIAAKGEVGAAEVRRALGILPTNASQVLFQMHKAKLVRRIGERSHYRYVLP